MATTNTAGAAGETGTQTVADARAAAVDAINEAIRARLPGTPVGVRADAAATASDALDALIVAAKREAFESSSRVCRERMAMSDSAEPNWCADQIDALAAALATAVRS